MAVVRKKQDDKNLKVLRELVTSGGSGGNRCCFDCGQKGPTYVNMTIGSFVCTRCSGVLRGLTPPHRVKSISMATFTPEEIDFLKSHGNDICAKTWLGLWDPKRIVHQDQRELMIDKYERKRYYLEPASPLKSLTNSAATKAPPLANGSILNGMSNGIHLNGNSISTNTTNVSNNNNIISNGMKQTLENNLKNITLSPPSTLHLSNNSLNSNSSSSNSSRQQQQQNGYHFQTQFTPEENGFFDTKTNVDGNSNNKNNNNHSGLMNGGNTNSTSSSHLTNGGLSSITNHLNNCQISNKNSLNAQQNSNEAHFLSDKFTPDSDFVADFGSANIFNAVGTETTGTSAATGGVASNKSSVNPLNGFKIHQNGTNGGTNHINVNNFVNGEVANGKIATTTAPAATTKANAATTNGNCSVNSNANANFADFDHASIYNAAVYQPSIYNNATLNNSMSCNNNNFFANNYNYRSDYFSTSSITSYSSYNNSNNNNSVATSAYSKSNNNNTNYYNTVQNTNRFFNDVNGIHNYNSQTQPQVQQQQQIQQPPQQQQQQQWNVWQQFQSPLSTPSSEQNRWSLPMSFNSTSNSLSSSATFTSNSSINSTPPADRYAALKDLDDQLRESKTSLNGSSFSSPAPAAASPNPFTQSTPIAITGAPATANPFQTSLSQPIPSATNIFSTNHNHPNQHQQTLFGGTSPPFSATPPSFLGYNGFGSMNGGSNVGNGINGSMLTNGGTLNNGCGGLAYVPQQVTTGGNAVITNMKNPFATVNTLSNSNNPFL